MKHTRKHKIEQAKALLQNKHTHLLDCLTATELDKLKQHSFNAEAYINNKVGTVFTRKAEDKKTVSEILAKLDKHAESIGVQERTTVHISLYNKDTK